MPGALVFTVAVKRMPLDCLAQVDNGGGCIPGSHGTVAIEEMILDNIPSTRYFIDRDRGTSSPTFL